MSSPVKAIKTIYNGYRFRSRLEARWAVFFDALGIEYEYEPAMLEVGRVFVRNYIPDFYLPRHSLTVEIKGVQPTEIELNKAAGAAHDAEDVLILYGNIRDHLYQTPGVCGGWVMRDHEGLGKVRLIEGYGFSECPRCKYIGIGESGIPEGCDPTAFGGEGCYTVDEIEDENHSDGRKSPRITSAYNRAIHYKFNAADIRQCGIRNHTDTIGVRPTEKMIRYACYLHKKRYGYSDEMAIEGMDFGEVKDLINDLKRQEDW